MACIEIGNLCFTYPGREVPTLRGITARVRHGSFVLLTGPTGCGKSTLLRALSGLIPHASVGSCTGVVRLDGEAIAAQPLVAVCQQVSLLFQNPDDQLFCTLVEDEIAFGLENLGFPPEEIRKRLDTALDRVGLSGFGSREVSSLSGGEKQRVALAAICAMQPSVLLLDEPTSYLDPLGRRDIRNSVMRLNRELGITVIWATHRTREIAPLCDHVWLMDAGSLCLDVPKAEAFRDTSRYRRLGVQVPVLESGSAASRPPSLKRMPCVGAQGALLNVQNLHFRYPNTERDAVRAISFEVACGEVVAIMGANGSGKTTLIHLIAGLLRPLAGAVTVDGKLRGRVKLHRLAGEVGIVFQDPDLLLQAVTVREEVAFGPKNLKFSERDLRDRVSETLERFDLGDLGLEVPYALSRGQRQRTAVAAAFSLHPRLFLLDEPTTGQDARHLHRLMDGLCGDIRHARNILIFTTHDIELSSKYADRMLLLHEGTVIFDGDPDIAIEDQALLQQASLYDPPPETAQPS